MRDSSFYHPNPQYENELTPEQVQELRKSTKAPVYLSFKTGVQVDAKTYAQELTELVNACNCEYQPIVGFDPQRPFEWTEGKLMDHVKKALEHRVDSPYSAKLGYRLTAAKLAEITGLNLNTINMYNRSKEAQRHTPVPIDAFAAIVDGIAAQVLKREEYHVNTYILNEGVERRPADMFTKDSQKGQFTCKRESTLYELLDIQPDYEEIQSIFDEQKANSCAREQRIIACKHLALVASTLSEEELKLLCDIAKRLNRNARMPKHLYDPQLLKDKDPDPEIDPVSFAEVEHQALCDLDNGAELMDVLLSIMFCSINKEE